MDPAGQLTTWDSQVEIRYRQLYIQTDKQADRQTDIQKNRYADRQTDIIYVTER